MAKTHVTLSNLLRKDFLAVLIVVVSAFSWYFPLYVFFQNTLERSQVEFSILLTTLSIHYIGAIGSAFAGTALIKEFSSRSTFLCLWMIIGVVSSAMLIMLDTSNIAYLLLVSFILGVSLGLGFPSCLAYFGDYTFEENRGRLGGITFFASGLGMLLIGLLVSMFTFAIGVLIFTFWRGLGLILFLLVRPKQEVRQNMEEVSYKSVLTDRSLALYLVPWTMFCLINFLEIPMLRGGANILFGENLTFLFPIAEFGIGGVVALIGGAFADSIGRKRVVIFGFMVLGIAYAVLGLFSNVNLSWYLLIVLDGIAWGIFSLIFYMVVWADLARARIKEKYYLIGVLPFLISTYMQIPFTPYAELIPISVAFSLASFFLFLAVLPLLYAPETLSEKEIEKKRLKNYLENAKKIKEKRER
jgi:MFS family permease